MEIKGIFAILLGIIGVLLLILALASPSLGQYAGSNWTTVGQGVTAFIVVIIVFAIAASTVVILLKRR